MSVTPSVTPSVLARLLVPLNRYAGMDDGDVDDADDEDVEFDDDDDQVLDEEEEDDEVAGWDAALVNFDAEADEKDFARQVCHA